MPNDYTLPDSKRDQLISSLEGWLSDEELSEIAVARRHGSAESLQGSIDSDELVHIGDASQVLDEVLERWGERGGKFTLRAIFGRHEGGEKGGQPKRMATRRFQLSRARADQRSASRGVESGVEALSSSLGGALDTLQRQVASQGEQQASLLSSVLERTDNATLNRVQEITTYQRTIMELQTELAEERILRAVSEAQPVVPAELLVSVVQTLAPSVTQLLGAVSAKLTGGVADLDAPPPEVPGDPAA
jgi:hypothetical protein